MLVKRVDIASETIGEEPRTKTCREDKTSTSIIRQFAASFSQVPFGGYLFKFFIFYQFLVSYNVVTVTTQEEGQDQQEHRTTGGGTGLES